MKIISEAEHEVSVSFSHNFGQPNKYGEIELCFGFDCTESGKIKPLKYDAAKANLAKCLAGEDGIVSMGIHRFSHSYNHPAVGECVHRKKHVSLGDFTNTCDCGADYNMSGQLLAHRSQWGEETGESLSDILGIK
jgi:hypothetical protein